MTRFANAYWSPDYRSGIELLTKQLSESFDQLHELRKFIFNYMNYHHSNSEFMAKLAKESFPMSSSFREKRAERRVFSGTIKYPKEQVPKEVDIKYIFKEFVDRTSLELQLQLNLASEIETEVLGKITAFVKLHEPQMKTTLDRFQELLDEYDDSRLRMESSKQKYDEMIRLGELEEPNRADHESDENTASGPSTPKKDETLNRIAQTHEGAQEKTFTFPLILGGGIKFDDEERLEAFLSKAIATIKTVRRKIPFPGYRNEIFSSEQLCDYLKTHRPHGFNPTRVSLERVGQGLIDKKIIVGTGLFSHKFKSEGMWFEWSQDAVDFAEFKDQSTSNIISLSKSLLNLEESSKKVNEVAASTSKKFNDLFKNVKTSLMKPKFSEEVLQELEEEYNESYEDVQRVKHLLDMEIFYKSQMFEKFEKVRIEVIYQSLTKLLEILFKHSSVATDSLHHFASNFIEKLNKPENYLRDLHNLLTKNSTGIYFPAIVLPHHGLKDHSDLTTLNVSFQNIRLNFNLYKDIPLQVKYSDADPESLLSTWSLPLLLKNTIEATLKAPKAKLRQYWIASIDHQEYWLVKLEIIQLIQGFQPDENLDPQDEKAVEIALVKAVVEQLSKTSVKRQLNFLKNWLLETSDSVIPCTVYDSLLNLNGVSVSNRATADDYLKILSSIPRGNLCSLIFILESIAFIFDLKPIQGYGLSDDIVELQDEDDDLGLIVDQLNSMDTIGAVPFLHLILRPSVIKSSTGFKPSMLVYNSILQTLLRLDIREKLCLALIANERKFIERSRLQEQNLGLHIKANSRVTSKNRVPSRVTAEGEVEDKPSVDVNKTISSPTPKTANSISGDQFSLRPFRTGSTPRPSPMSSPVHKKGVSADITRARSDSGHLISIDKTEEEGQDD